MNPSLKKIVSPINKAIADNINKQLRLSGISQSELARRLDLKQPTLSHLLNSGSKITIQRLIEIADILGIDFRVMLDPPQVKPSLSRREVKFRGKSNGSCRWVYGSLVRNPKKGYTDIYESHSGNGLYKIEIEDSTVGQLTGLTDRSGLEIYEGDVVQELNMMDLFQVVFTDYANFGLRPVSAKAVKHLKDYEYNTIDPSYAGTTLTVIGNIHDNPELIG